MKNNLYCVNQSLCDYIVMIDDSVTEVANMIKSTISASKDKNVRQADDKIIEYLGFLRRFEYYI